MSIAPGVSEPDDLGWLLVLDVDDVREFLTDLEAAHADRSPDVLRACVAAWRTTAAQLDDPLRRRVLLGPFNEDDFVAVEEPAG